MHNRPVHGARCAAVVLVLALVCAFGVARAGEPAASNALPVVHPSVEKAQAEAVVRDRLIFLCLDPDIDEREALTDDLIHMISKRCVVAVVPGQVGDETADALRVRYRLLQPEAAWLILTPGGALIDSINPLGIKAYVEAILSRAEEKTRDYRARLTALEASHTESSSVDLLNFHLDHRDYEAVLALCREALKAEGTPSLEVLGAYASALGATLARDEERRVLGRLIESYPDHPESIEWRIARVETAFHPLHLSLARKGHPAGEAVREPGVRELHRLLGSRRNLWTPAEEARIRFGIGETFARNYVERLVHYDWVAEHAPGTWYGGEALVYLGRTMDWLGDFGAAVRYYEELLRRHPEHAQTVHVREELSGLRRQLEESERPLTVEVSRVPDAPSTTSPVSIAVQVRNTAAAPASRILIRCEGYGAYENLTQMRTEVEALGPGEGVQVEFRLQPTSSGTIHLVVSAEGVSTGGSGEWLRIEVP